MKRVLAFVLFIGMAGQANAAIFDAGSPGSFSYGGFTWDTSFSPTGNNDGFIATGGDVDPLLGEVQIVGSDTGTGVQSPTDALSTMSTAITESGTISVAWDYFTNDAPAVFDPFIWLVNGVADLTSITNDALGTGGQTGTFTQHVDAGTLFGLAIGTDNLFGGGAFSADVALSNFSFTSDNGSRVVPIPPAFLLFGTALAGLGFFRRKKFAV
jgi:hypothetical protein